MKKLLCVLGLSVAVAFAVATVALAAGLGSTYKVSAPLGAKGEVPAPKAPAGAKGAFTGVYKENPKGAVLTWRLSFSGLSGKAMAAHIHLGKRGVSGPVVVPLCGPCTSGASGKATISKKLIAALESGGAYINVHTAKNPGGEIRGQASVKG